MKDVVTIEENFAAKFRDENLKTVNPHPGAIDGKKVFVGSGPDIRTVAQTIELFDQADFLDSRGWLSDVYCYFTPDSLGIITGVAHYMGDYAAFEIKYKDIADNIKHENKVWRDFFPDGEGQKGQ
ncbi:MAG: hypothetical protein P4N59_18055 [Negativicutes bacterium]|nr:hypothetical protein [Negativicutes bacterium]